MNRSPYPGLRPFQRDEADLFFGREVQTTKLLTRLNSDSHFVAVIGQSGYGKSSLVKTGLLHSLEPEVSGNAGAYWRIVEMRPGNHPFTNLAQALLDTKALGHNYIARFDDQKLAERYVSTVLQRGPLGLHELLDRAALPSQTNLLIVIDQFEEIFRYQEHAANQAIAFINLLLQSVKPYDFAVPIYIVITMRSDYIGDSAKFEGLPEKINENLFLTPRMSRDELRSAIVYPARVCEGDVDERLVNTLLNDVGNNPEQLPILQHALMQMWNFAREESPNEIVLTLKHYQKIGKLEKNLSIDAEKIYTERLTEPQKRIAKILFKSLTKPIFAHEDTRNPVELQKVVDAVEAAESKKIIWQDVADVVDVFRATGHNFIEPLRGDLKPETILDIIHESLIRQWSRLRGWVDEEVKNSRTYIWIEENALRCKQGESSYWQGAELQTGLHWLNNSLSSELWTRRYIKEEYKEKDVEENKANHKQRHNLVLEFLEKSKRRRRNSRRFMLIIGIAIFGSAVLLGFVFNSWLGNIERKSKYLTQISQQNQAAHPYKASLYSLAALDTSVNKMFYYASKQGILGNAITQGLEFLGIPEDRNLYPSQNQFFNSLYAQRGVVEHAAEVNHATFNDTGTVFLTASDDETAKLWHTHTNTVKFTLQQNPKNAAQGHRDDVTYAAFSPDNQLIVTTSDDKTVQLWNAKNGRWLKTLIDPQIAQQTSHQDEVRYADFSPDGQRLATASLDKTAKLWAVSTGQLINTLVGHQDYVYQATFSPDGQYIATVSDDRTVRLWNGHTGTLLHRLKHDQATAYVAFSHHPPYTVVTAAAGGENNAFIWNLQGNKLHNLDGHRASVWYAAFSPDDTQIITTSSDYTAHLWDAKTGELQRVLTGHNGVVHEAAFSPEGKQVVTVSRDNTARLWNPQTGALNGVLTGHQHTVWQAAFSADGRKLVTASWDNTARLWHTGRFASVSATQNNSGIDDTGSENNELMASPARFSVMQHKSDIYSVAVSDDSEWIATASQDATVGVWAAAQNGQLLNIFDGHDGGILTVRFSPDQQHLLTAATDNTARIWSINEPTESHILTAESGTPTHNTLLFDAQYSPNGRYIITAAADGTAKLWNAQARTLSSELQDPQLDNAHSAEVYSATFSPNSRLAATASQDGTAKLWQTSTSELQHTLAAHDAPVYFVVFSPDGQLLATTSWDKTARLWDTDTGQQYAELSGHTEDVLYAAFNPEGTYLVTTSMDDTAKLWRVNTGRLLRTFTGHEDTVMFAAFSPDGQQLVTASQDDTARLWHINASSAFAVLNGHEQDVLQAKFSPDGQQIVTASADGSARLWWNFSDLSTAMTFAQQRIPDNLARD